MPGSEFDGYSETHEGLFGIKVRMKLGDLQLTTIISQEDGQASSQHFNPSESVDSNSFNETEIYYDKVFFLDTSYQRYYFNPSSPKPPRITKVALLKLASTSDQNNYEQNKNTPQYSNFRNVGNGIHEILKQYGGTEGGNDFYCDNEAGFVVLSSSRDLSGAGDQLVAFYVTEDGKTSSDRGLIWRSNQTSPETGDTVTWNSEIIHPYVLRPQNLDSTMSFQWKLMWKNVYKMGVVSQQNREQVRIRIQYQNSGETKFPHETVLSGGQTIRMVDFFGFTNKD